MLNSSAIRVKLPEELYRQVQHRASKSQRSIEDELVAVVEYAFAQNENQDDLSLDIESTIEQLAYLSDQELWQAAKQTAPTELSARMQELVLKQQAQGLTHAEEDEARQLQQYGHKLMLVRAEAALLLQQRGHDISHLHLSPV